MTTSTASATAPRPHGQTRERILETAQYLVQTDSYDGFSFRDIAAAVGIRKASIYHHFESKEALAAAMAERARERFRDWGAAQAALAPPARLAAYCFDLYGGHLGAGHRLCPGASLVAGWSHLSGEVREAVLALMGLHLEFLEKALHDGAADGSLQLPAGRDAAAAAKWFAACVQGALIWARATDSREEFELICHTTLASLSISG